MRMRRVSHMPEARRESEEAGRAMTREEIEALPDAALTSLSRMVVEEQDRRYARRALAEDIERRRASIREGKGDPGPSARAAHLARLGREAR